MHISLSLPDPKRINRALFGAWYEEDIYDRFCGLFPRAMRAFRTRIPAAMRARGLIFVHVPRVAGTSISRALYGRACTHHHSMRYYQTLDPDFCAHTPSFALLRDPFDRFISAFFFVRSGGTPECRLSDVFTAQTRHIRSVDDYLDFLEARGALDLDFIMRPQSWFVCDRATGRPLVKDLFLYGEDEGELIAYLANHGVSQLPWLNRANRHPLPLTSRQRSRIARLYADDLALIESVRASRGQTRAAWAVAAE